MSNKPSNATGYVTYRKERKSGVLDTTFTIRVLEKIQLKQRILKQGKRQKSS